MFRWFATALAFVGASTLSFAQSPAPAQPASALPELVAPQLPATPATPANALPELVSPLVPAAPASLPAVFDWSKFHLGGQYRIEPNASNLSFHSPTISDNQATQYLVLQRMRLWLTYNPTENVEGYLQMQVGQLPWGTGYDFSKVFPADITQLKGDNVGIMVRRAWLAAKDETLGTVRAGILDWHDSFRDTMASSDYTFNTGGIEWSNKYEEFNNLKVKAAALLLNDQAFIDTTLIPGSHSAYLFAWDADQPVGERHSVGFSAYYLNDRGGYSYPTLGAYSLAWDLWVGVRGKLGFETVPISGFLLANTGERDNTGAANFTHTGWASQLEFGPMKIGPGKLSMQGVYSSGGKGNTSGHSNEFRTLAQSFRDNFGAQGYWSYLQLTSPNGPGDISDLGVGFQNRGFGLATGQMKYEYPLLKRLSGATAGGWLRSATVNPDQNRVGIIGVSVADRIRERGAAEFARRIRVHSARQEVAHLLEVCVAGRRNQGIRIS